eukprot:jgi/Tetstr1/426378/TSEL_016690.t1
MPRFTGYTTGQTFKGEEVTATQSYAQLATHPVQAVPVGPNDRRTEPSTRPAAGLPGRTAAKGAGAWTQQVDYTLSTPEIYGNATGQTEMQRTMTRHAAPRTLPAPPPPSDMNLGTQPRDFRSVTSLDYTGRSGERRTYIRPPESKDAIFRKEWDADFKSTAKTMHGAKEPQLGRPASERAGQPLTTRPQYNIITGGEATSNYRHEHWDAGRDYRRATKPLGGSGSGAF